MKYIVLLPSMLVVVCSFFFLESCAREFRPQLVVKTNNFGDSAAEAGAGQKGAGWYGLPLSRSEGVVQEIEQVRSSFSELRQDDADVIKVANFWQAKVHDGNIIQLVLADGGRAVITGGNDGRVVMTMVVGGRDDAVGETRDETREDSRIDTESYTERSPVEHRTKGDVELRSKVLLTSERPISALALSESERYLAIAWGSYVSIYDFRSHELVADFIGITSRITSLAWDPREQYLAIGLAIGDLYLWDLSLGFPGSISNTKHLEAYIAQTSPVVRLVFHPAGRVILSAEQKGSIALWRLLRTEDELGLRDYGALMDAEKTAKTKQDISIPLGKISDMYINDSASVIRASVDDGHVYTWKMRGLRAEAPLFVEGGAVMSITEFLPERNATSPVIVTSSQDQRLRLWCNTSEFSGKLLAVSETFKETIPIIRHGSDASVLWAVQKTGNLLFVDLRSLERSADLRNKILRRCITTDLTTG